MALPWSDTTGFHIAPCLPCCVTPSPPGDCACALLIPLNGASPYASYATAAAVVAGPKLSNCIGFYAGIDAAPSAFTVTFNGTTVAIACTSASDPATAISISVLAGKTISAAFTRSTTGGSGSLFAATMAIYDCAGASVDSQAAYSGSSSASGTLTSIAMPADGVYTVILSSNMLLGLGTPSSEQNTFDVTSTGAIVTNPVIALWDDSGTTRQLEACPKLYLPIFTESTGSWFASCADAAAEMTDPLKVSNCVGYSEGSADVATFTATGGSTLVFASTYNTPVSGSNSYWGSINAVGGETITITLSGGTVVAAVIYDYDGNIVETTGLFSFSPWTSLALPYTGRYIVKVISLVAFGDPAVSADSATISSSGTMSANPIQALYGDGTLTCPNRLNCGDSC